MPKYNIIKEEDSKDKEIILNCYLKNIDGVLRLVGGDHGKAIVGLMPDGRLIKYSGIPKEFGLNIDKDGRILE